MEDQGPTYSTQKEEPAAPPPPPSSFPTPAHPFPKFLPKPIALIILVLIIGVLLTGFVFTVYNLGRNSVLKELNPTAPEIPPPGPVFQASPTPDPTANWKTYEEEGFSFKLPPSWTPTQESGRSNLSLIFKEPGNNDRFIRVEKSDGPIEKYLKEGGGDASLGFSAKHEKDIFGDKNMYRLTITHYGYGPKTEKYEITEYGYEILIDSGSDIYSIYGDLNDKDFVDQILSTFKFTE